MYDRFLTRTQIRHSLISIFYYRSDRLWWHYRCTFRRVWSVSPHIIINQYVLIPKLSSGIDRLWELWCLRSPDTRLLVSQRWFRHLSFVFLLCCLSQCILPLMWWHLLLFLLFFFNFFKNRWLLYLSRPLTADWGSEALLLKFVDWFIWWNHAWTVWMTTPICTMGVWSSDYSDWVATCIIVVSKGVKLILIHFNRSIKLECSQWLCSHLELSEWQPSVPIGVKAPDNRFKCAIIWVYARFNEKSLQILHIDVFVVPIIQLPEHVLHGEIEARNQIGLKFFLKLEKSEFFLY